MTTESTDLVQPSQIAMVIDVDPYRVNPGERVNLDARPTSQDGQLEKAEGKQHVRGLIDELCDLQQKMYAQGKHALLVVLQAMDAAGKDSTVRRVFGPINPQGCRVVSFRAPTTTELAHDYLWRIHHHAPPKGHIGVFNRSHYEEVLIARVKDLVPRRVWQKRYDHINAFEQMLTDEGTHVVKFYLHISKDYQKQRLQRRLDDPSKHWKFNPADLVERARWDEYRQAFEEALSRGSTQRCPWYVVPAERRWYRDLVIASVLVKLLRSLDMQPPKPDFDADAIEID